MAKRFLRAFLYSLLGLLILVAVLFLSLQVGAGRAMWLGIAQQQVKTLGLEMELKEIRGTFPGDFTISYLKLKDKQGVWLEMENFTLQWSPFALISGAIEVQTFAAEKLTLSRLPDLATAESKEPEADRASEASGDSSFINNIRLGQLKFDSIRLGTQLLNIPQAQADLYMGVLANGDFNPSHNIAELNLQLTHLYWQDQNSTDNTLLLALDYNRIEQSLKLLARANFPKDFIDPFIPPEGIHPGDIRLDLDGEAPLAVWQGKLNVQASELLKLETNLSITQSSHQAYWLGLDSNLRVLPKFLAAMELTEQLADLKLRSKLGYDDNKLIIEGLTLETFLARLESHGEINLPGQSINLQSNIRIPQIEKLQDITQIKVEHQNNRPMSGKVDVSAEITGSFKHPLINFAITGKQLSIEQISLADSQINGSLKLSEADGSNKPQINAQVKGEFNHLELASLSHMPAQNVNWQLAVQQDPQGLLHLESFKIDNSYLQSRLTGNLDTNRLKGEFDWKIDLTDLSILDKTQRLSGNKQLQARVVLHPQGEHIELEMNGRLQDLQGLPQAAEILLGNQPQWQARLDLLDKNHLQIEHIKVDGRAVQLIGQAELTMDSGAIQAKVESHIDDLQQFEALLAKDIQGSLSSTLKVDGSLNEPIIGLNLKGSELLFDQYAIRDMNMEANASDLFTEPHGKLLFKLGPRQEQIDVSSSFKLAKHQLQLPDLTVLAPKSLIKGELDFDLDKSLAAGEIKGQLRQLNALEFWHRQKPLNGDLAFQLHLNGEREQNLKLNANALTLNFADTKVNGLKLNSQIKDLQQQPKINTELDIKSLQQGLNSLGRLNLKLNGRPEKLDIKLKSDNTKQQLAIDLAAQVEQQVGGLKVLLSRLNGQLYKQKLSLKKSSRLVISENQLELTPLQLNLGNAQLFMQANAPLHTGANNNNLDARLSVKGFSLQTLGGFNLPQPELAHLNGMLNADMALSGNMKNPLIQAQVNLNQLALNTPHGKDIPKLDLVLEAGFNNNQFQSQFDLSGLTQEPIQASVAVPLGLSLQPFVLDFNQAAALKGQLSADMDLSNIVNWFHLDQQDLKGSLKTELLIGGSVHQPLIDGEIVLLDGKYENAVIGTILDNIEMETQIERNLLSLNKLQAGDGGAGMLKAQGKVRLFGDNQFPYDFNLVLEQARLLRRDDLTIVLGGNLATQGDKNKGGLEGKIVVNQGEFFLPEGGSADTPELAVTEVNQTHSDTEDSQTSQAGYPMDLDMKIEVPDKFFVRGRGLESEWKGDLKISGNSAEPNLLGFLEVVRGHFNFLSHRFNFREGKIDFLGGIPPKPRLNFDMAAQGKDVLGIIKVTGSADKPKLKLESEPMLPQDEVLARLLFDKELSEISGFQALQLASAVRTLATGGTSVMDNTRSSLGVDTLDFNGDEASGNSVKAGKYISEDVFVEVESGMGAEGSKVRVEMELTPRISVDSTVDGKSKTGFGVNLNYDY